MYHVQAKHNITASATDFSMKSTQSNRQLKIKCLTPQLLTSIFASKMFSLHVSQQVAPEFGPMWAI